MMCVSEIFHKARRDLLLGIYCMSCEFLNASKSTCAVLVHKEIK